jgi:acetyltransferase
VLSCWLGEATARAARTVLQGAGVASYDTPATAAAAVGHLTDWGRAQAALLRVPDRGAAPEDAAARGREAVAAIFAAAAAENRRLLTEPEAKAALAAYGVPVPEIRVARSPDEAGAIAAEMLKAGGSLVVRRGRRHSPSPGGWRRRRRGR